MLVKHPEGSGFHFDFALKYSFLVISLFYLFSTCYLDVKFTCPEKSQISSPVIFSSLVSQLDAFHVASDSPALGGLV